MADVTNIERVLLEARNPDGSQRFYAPGQHPATRQLRDALAKAEEFSDDSASTEEYVTHMRGELAKFEEIEERAKRDYLRAMGITSA